MLPLSTCLFSHFSFSPTLFENHISTYLSLALLYTLFLDLFFFLFFSSPEEAIWRNVMTNRNACDVFNSYWDELRRICSVDRHALYKNSAVALKLLMLPLPPPASSLLSLVFSFSLRVWFLALFVNITSLYRLKSSVLSFYFFKFLWRSLFVKGEDNPNLC